MDQIRTFYRCSNNGVLAIVSAEMFDAWQRARTEIERPPVFIFAGSEYTLDSPWFHGPHELADVLTEGAIVLERSFHVPCSNQFERTGSDRDCERELACLGSPLEMLQTFGRDALMRIFEANHGLSRA